VSTYSTKSTDIQHNWLVIDANGQILGRLAAQVAVLLRGKNKTIFTPHLDVGDHVVVINAAKIRVTGRKLESKMYYHHTGYPGGIKSVRLDALMATRPEEVVAKAVRGMLPRNKLGDAIFTKLKVYAGDSHPHQAQKPKEIDV
jgi:large subunit ribosomal protein L13